jgi:hypothetical protein
MKWVVVRWFHDLSGGCRQEGLEPEPDRFEPLGKPYNTEGEAQKAAQEASERYHSSYSRVYYLVLPAIPAVTS